MKTVAVSGLFTFFVVAGGAWSGMVRALPHGLPRTVAVVALGVVFVATYVILLVRRIRPVLGGTPRFGRAALLIVLDLVLLLVGFALMYQPLGLLDTRNANAAEIHDFWTSLYFSIVTFTTLGFGDLVPTGAGRSLAALQALTGYVVLGVLASTASSVLAPHTPAGFKTVEDRTPAAESE